MVGDMNTLTQKQRWWIEERNRSLAFFAQHAKDYPKIIQRWKKIMAIIREAKKRNPKAQIAAPSWHAMLLSPADYSIQRCFCLFFSSKRHANYMSAEEFRDSLKWTR